MHLQDIVPSNEPLEESSTHFVPVHYDLSLHISSAERNAVTNLRHLQTTGKNVPPPPNSERRGVPHLLGERVRGQQTHQALQVHRLDGIRAHWVPAGVDQAQNRTQPCFEGALRSLRHLI